MITEDKKQTLFLAAEIIGRVCFLVFFALLSYNLLIDFLAHYRLSPLILLTKELMTLYMVAIRNIPKKISFEPHVWLIALLSALSSLFLRPTGTEDNVIGLIIQCSGMIIACIGIFYLNKSFGIVPANRGIKSKGLYQVVRHPIYAGYIISCLGFLINHSSNYNLAIFTSIMIFMIARIFLEEKLLMESPEYQELASRVKYRLIPGVW